MTEKKKSPPLKAAGATQKISKDELAELLKKAEEEDPDPDAAAEGDDKPAAQKQK